MLKLCCRSDHAPWSCSYYDSTNFRQSGLRVKAVPQDYPAVSCPCILFFLVHPPSPCGSKMLLRGNFLKKNCLLLPYESKFLIHGKLINIFPFYFEGLATLMFAPTPKFNFQILREFAVDIYFTHIIPWNARKHVFISSIRIAFSSFLTCVM